MKRKIISLILTFIMIAAALPAAAHQGFTEENLNFESYSSGMPSAANGEFASISATSDYNIVTSGAPTGNATYGNSVKMVQKKEETAGSVYGGIRYVPETALLNTISFNASLYIDSAAQMVQRTIRLRDGVGSGTTLYAINFTNKGTIEVFGHGTNKTEWKALSWYDISASYNINTKLYKITVYEDGNQIIDKTGTASTELSSLKSMEFRMESKTSALTCDQIFYLDNFSLKTDFEFKEEAEAATVDSFDFSNLSADNPITSISGDLGKFSTKNAVFTNVSDDEKGTSVSYTFEGANSDNYLSYDIPSTNTTASGAYYSKQSFKLKDYNFNSIRFRYYNNDGKYFGNSLEVTGTSTIILGNVLKHSNSSDNYVIPIDCWVDFELSFNHENGHIKAVLFDGTQRFVVENDSYATADYINVPMYRTRIIYNGLAANSTSSTILIDDVKIGYIEDVDSFYMAKNASTTGPDITVDEKDSVKAVFSNKLDKDSFNASSVTFPYNDVADYTLSFPDDYTVQINFNKELGKHYHIAFTNVADTYGNTLTDFIEFDMAKAPYITGNVEFTDKDGNAVRYLTSGKVTMSVYTQAGDGVSKMANIWLALYTSTGELSDVKFESVAYEAENIKRSISITVPSDGANYKVKGGVWKDDLTPLAFGEVRPQVVIFKLDDLRYEYTIDKKPVYDYTDFVSLANWANEEKVALAFGVICNTLEDEDGIDKSGYYKAIADMDASEYIEIWCHGYTHEQTGDADTGYSAEFNAPLNDQIATLQNCANIVYEKTGVTLRSLGVPHNIKNEDTIKALESVPQFKTLIASGSAKYTGSTFIHLQNQLGFEEKTGVLLSLDTIKENFNKASSKEYVMFQGHAGRWSDEDIAKFKELVAYLKTQNVVFMTPTEYYNFIK